MVSSVTVAESESDNMKRTAWAMSSGLIIDDGSTTDASGADSSVSTKPGQSAHARTPCKASSAVIDLANDARAAFVAE